MISVDEFRRRAAELTSTERIIAVAYAKLGSSRQVAEALGRGYTTTKNHLGNGIEKCLFDCSVGRRGVLFVAHLWRSGLAEEWDDAGC